MYHWELVCCIRFQSYSVGTASTPVRSRMGTGPGLVVWGLGGHLRTADPGAPPDQGSHDRGGLLLGGRIVAKETTQRQARRSKTARRTSLLVADKQNPIGSSYRFTIRCLLWARRLSGGRQGCSG